MEFRNNEKVIRQDGSVTRRVTFEDDRCNQVVLSVQEPAQMVVVDTLRKGTMCDLVVDFRSGVSKSGNHYEMLTPGVSDASFCVKAKAE